MEYAGFWRRFVAYIIDTIVMYIVMIPLFMIFGAAGSLTGSTQPDEVGAGFWIAYLLTIVLQWLYFAVMESSSRQATLGKMALGIVVTGEDGQRISFGRATGRFFGKILSGLILLIGYIMAAFTERKQALHDMLASTLVLKGKPGEAEVDPGVFA